jgi:hypothetical protein
MQISSDFSRGIRFSRASHGLLVYESAYSVLVFPSLFRILLPGHTVFACRTDINVKKSTRFVSARVNTVSLKEVFQISIVYAYLHTSWHRAILF